MKTVLLVIAIVLFVIVAFIGLTGGTWDTFSHLVSLLGFGLAFFASSFLPIP